MTHRSVWIIEEWMHILTLEQLNPLAALVGFRPCSNPDETKEYYVVESISVEFYG